MNEECTFVMILKMSDSTGIKRNMSLVEEGWFDKDSSENMFLVGGARANQDLAGTIEGEEDQTRVLLPHWFGCFRDSNATLQNVEYS